MGKKYDTVFMNGKIFTANPQQPYAEAFAVKDGQIVWVGEGKDLAPEAETLVDLKGKRVLPGFVDSHMHPIMLADSFKQISCLPPAIHSIEELEDEIRMTRDAQGLPRWIEGWGYDEGKLAEKRTPNRYDLDKGASDVPVSIVRTCGHVRCVNSKALELAGIDRNTPDPVGGKIDHDEHGEPTGVLRENARNLITAIMPEMTMEKTVSNLVDMNEMLISQGITTVADMGNLTDGDYYEAYQEARAKGFLPRVAMYYMWDSYKNDKNFSLTPEQTDEHARTRVAGIKLIGDGSVSGRTAWCDRPYLGSDDDCGMPVCTPEDIQSAMEFCKHSHCQLAIHAMGAKTIDRAVDAVWQEKSWTKEDVPYVRLEHVAMPSKQAIERAAQSGIAFVTQPIFLYAEIESYLTNLGPERTKKNYPIQDMIDAGVKISFSTDAPATAWATPSDPFACLKGAVTRVAYDGTDCGEKHRVDIETALSLYTAKSAPMLGYHDIGQLAKGFAADFIVLDRDILSIPSEEIDQVKVDETFINGASVYQRTAK